MGEVMCPECGTKLNREEKEKGKCYLCGATFEGIVEETPREVVTPKENLVAKVLRVVAIAILVLGTILSILLNTEMFIFFNNYSTSFSFVGFLVYEVLTVFLSAIVLGMGEIVALLQKIKDK